MSGVVKSGHESISRYKISEMHVLSRTMLSLGAIASRTAIQCASVMPGKTPPALARPHLPSRRLTPFN